MALRDDSIQLISEDGYTLNVKHATLTIDKIWISQLSTADGNRLIVVGAQTCKITGLVNADYKLGIFYTNGSSETLSMRPLRAPIKPELYVSSVAGDLSSSVSVASLRAAGDFTTSALVGADGKLIAIDGFARSESTSSGMSASDAALVDVEKWLIVFNDQTTIFTKEITVAELALGPVDITHASIINYATLETTVFAVSPMGMSEGSDVFLSECSNFPDVVGAPTAASQDGVSKGYIQLTVPVPADVNTFSGASTINDSPSHDYITLSGDQTLKLYIHDSNGALRSISPSQPALSDLQGSTILVDVLSAIGEIETYTATWENEVGMGPASAASEKLLTMYPADFPAQTFSFVSFAQGGVVSNGQTSWTPNSMIMTVQRDAISTILSSGLDQSYTLEASSGVPIFAGDTFTEVQADGTATSISPGLNLELRGVESQAPSSSAMGKAGSSLTATARIPAETGDVKWTATYGAADLEVATTEITGFFTQSGLVTASFGMSSDNSEGNGIQMYSTEEWSSDGKDLQMRMEAEPGNAYGLSTSADIALYFNSSQVMYLSNQDMKAAKDITLLGLFTHGESLGHDQSSSVEAKIESRPQSLVSSNDSLLDLSAYNSIAQEKNGTWEPLIGDIKLHKEQDTVSFPLSFYGSDPAQMSVVQTYKNPSAPAAIVLSIENNHINSAEVSVSETADNGGRPILKTVISAYHADPGFEKTEHLGSMEILAASVSDQLIDASTFTGGSRSIANGDIVTAYAQQRNDLNSDHFYGDEGESNKAVPYDTATQVIVLDAAAKTIQVTHTSKGTYLTSQWALALDIDPSPSDSTLLKHVDYANPNVDPTLRSKANNTLTRINTFSYPDLSSDITHYFVSSTSDKASADPIAFNL